MPPFTRLSIGVWLLLVTILASTAGSTIAAPNPADPDLTPVAHLSGDATTPPGGDLSVLDLVVTLGERTSGVLEHPSPFTRYSVLLAGWSARNAEEPEFENGHRAEIYDEITDAPGRHVAEIADRVGSPASTLRYHLRVLEDDGIVQSTMIRGKRRFHPAGTDPLTVELDAALADPSTMPVLNALSDLESPSVSELADDLDLAASTVSYHLDSLEEAGLITRERTGRSVTASLRHEVRTRL